LKKKKNKEIIKKTMYENIIAIHNVLKKKTTWLNFQPTQYLKKLAKIILKQKNLKKKEEEINFG
jgi:hypothetical protein